MPIGKWLSTRTLTLPTLYRGSLVGLCQDPSPVSQQDLGVDLNTVQEGEHFGPGFTVVMAGEDDEAN